MNKTNLISLIALLAFIVALPLYAAAEPARMQDAQGQQRQQYIADGEVLYVDYCAACHGVTGEGIGVMPALNHPALAEADPEALFKTIARAAHGTTMAAWHVSEGGALNDYQIHELVAVLQFADWNGIGQTAREMDYQAPIVPAAEVGLVYLESELADDPHRCVACHEDPEVHLGRFGLNCARCHSSVAWTPALLTKHTFALDHGGEGEVECQVCHVDNYYTNSCYECHDHQPDQMQAAHLAEGISEYENCSECHPTGASGEAGELMKMNLEQAILESVLSMPQLP